MQRQEKIGAKTKTENSKDRRRKGDRERKTGDQRQDVVCEIVLRAREYEERVGVIKMEDIDVTNITRVPQNKTEYSPSDYGNEDLGSISGSWSAYTELRVGTQYQFAGLIEVTATAKKSRK